MSVCIVTGSLGLVGSEAVNFFSNEFNTVAGIDNDMRKKLFGTNASVKPTLKILKQKKNYSHLPFDIRSNAQTEKIFRKYRKNIQLIVHTAAQPSHDWAIKDPYADFSINAEGTLTLLELSRKYCPDAAFIYTSTNKVYGDTPNKLPLEEKETRWEIAAAHPFYDGIDETMNIDNSKHSLFGVSKLSADLLVQEYGKYFGMKTGVFRAGCITGPNHAGTEQHGFLSYLMKCAVLEKPYNVFGYKGKQVRDNIHSYDLVNMFSHFLKNPRPGEIYNAGGGRFSNCSVIEGIALCEKISGKKMIIRYSNTPRLADHIWWISSTKKFQKDFPGWERKFNLETILKEIHASLK